MLKMMRESLFPTMDDLAQRGHVVAYPRTVQDGVAELKTAGMPQAAALVEATITDDRIPVHVGRHVLNGQDQVSIVNQVRRESKQETTVLPAVGGVHYADAITTQVFPAVDLRETLVLGR